MWSRDDFTVYSETAETRCEKIISVIHPISTQFQTKTFMIFAGRDIIVEEEIIFESLKEYKNLEHFVSDRLSESNSQWKTFFQNYDTDIPSDDFSKILKSFDSCKGASVFVKKDTHYQNKLRADLVVEVVKKIFSLKNKLWMIKVDYLMMLRNIY